MNDILNIELKTGEVKIQMYPSIAPRHIQQITALANAGFYNGLKFHRVIDGFMAQGGCPLGTGTGNSGSYIDAEFNNMSHERGVCSMARSQDPNSASSQFFICLKDSKFLDGQYTAWGKVIEGMDHVDQIKKGNQANNGSVDGPDCMIRVWVERSSQEWKDIPIKIG